MNLQVQDHVVINPVMFRQYEVWGSPVILFKKCAISMLEMQNFSMLTWLMELPDMST